MVSKELLAAGPGQWVLAGARWGGRGRFWSVEVVWEWNGQWPGLNGLRE